ncbi:DNA repair protein RAD50, ABC-type ATPase/SMC superfamily [Ceraceosorus bombacis]|uniref:DNA repair protein RAD50, ABC-type ATPase/SMC superfamily n=1 Tax=Ceraceosorus bombacis TaxID=401625 RepID=A0A0P1BJP3_9BASI|nr:DNA repair protein RAD50, ABC-type ATPase/SMC superfamily [Ceraceosorus bombacis]
MKTLEGLLQVDDENRRNKRAVLSTKCAELDEEIPRLLGVSKSILDNVIFCHQEDSNWPLSEPSVLKKKFDDIFEATKYTKALENIRTIRKEQREDLRVQRVELESLKTDKERSDGIREKRRRLEMSLTENENKLDDLNEDIRALTRENKGFYDKAVRFRETVAKAETMEEKMRLHRENMEQLRTTMTHIDEPQSELQRRKDRFGEHLQRQRVKQDSLKRKVLDSKDQLQSVEERRSRKIGEKGGLENDRKHHDQAIAKREREIRRISGELSIKGFDTQGMTATQVEDFAQRIATHARKAEADFDDIRSEGVKKERHLTNVYQELRGNLRAKEVAKEQASDTARRVKERKKRAQDELDGFAITTSDLTVAEKDFKDAQARCKAVSQEMRESEHDDQLRDINKNIRHLDQQREELTVELNSLNRNADQRAKLDVKKAERDQKAKEIELIMQRHESTILEHLGSKPSSDRLETEAIRVMSEKENAANAAERADQAANKELQLVEASLSFARSSLQENQARSAALSKEIRNTLLDNEQTDIASGLNECNREIATVTNMLSGMEHLAGFFKRVKLVGDQDHTCFGCGRSLAPGEQESFHQHVEEQIKLAARADRNELESDLAEWNKRLAAVQSLVPKQELLNTIDRVEVPKAKGTVETEQARLAEASERAETTAQALTKARSDLKELNTLKNLAADVSRLLSEVFSLSKEITALESDLLRTGSTRTGNDVQAEIDAQTDQLKQAKRKLQTVQSQKEHLQGRLTQAERAVHQAELAVASKRQEASKREAAATRVEELTNELQEAHRLSEKLSEEVTAASTPIRKAQNELEQFKTEQSTREAAASSKAAELGGHTKLLAELDSQAQRFIVQRGEEKMEDCIQAIENFTSEMQSIQKDIQAVEADAAKIEKEFNESKATERNINDNLRYRTLDADVARIQTEYDSLNLEEAYEANRTWTEKYNTSKERENKLNGEAAHLGGVISSLRTEIQGREQELRDSYQNVEKRYTAKLVAFKTGELADRDLELYVKALENAIMRYHAIKMEEINEQIRYLWGRTYQGTDIDTILIKSDNEGARANRSYFYRVCMVKDTVEMDMRGRCSAGQKVLASIIIRLALADSFGENCGILALDEPTTNLDKENIVALAKSLNDIIKERKSQSNFQLIVITHDEDFLTMLGQSDSLDYYWRCSRTAHQTSIIERERIQ